MAGEDKHSKKHPASDHKKRQLKKKGTVAKSQDVPMAFGLLAAFGVMVSMRKFYLDNFTEVYIRCIESIGDINEPYGIDLVPLMLFVVVKVAMLSLPIMVAILLVGIFANLAQSGLIFTGQQLKPDIKKINPMSKLKQWFSIKSLQELGKSLAKILAASILGFFVWKGSLEAINDSVELEAAELLALGAEIIKKMFLQIIILYIVVAAIDFMFQKKNFSTEHKMTDKEVKDEYKQMEGDPYMKAKRRQVAQQIAFNASQDHVPDSDVVVINPTELAIALKYDPELSPVPYVVSKGEQRHADDIRSSARNAGVPVVRNKPLARALFEMCEIGDLVPEDLYRPVAEVLAYVFALKDETAGDEAAAVAAQAQAAAAQAEAAAHANPAAAPAWADEPPVPVHDLAEIQVPVVLPAGTSAANAGAGHGGAGWLQPQPVPAAPPPAGYGLTAIGAVDAVGPAWQGPVAPAAAYPAGTHAWRPAPGDPYAGAMQADGYVNPYATHLPPAVPAGEEAHPLADDAPFAWRPLT